MDPVLATLQSRTVKVSLHKDNDINYLILTIGLLVLDSLFDEEGDVEFEEEEPHLQELPPHACK